MRPLYTALAAGALALSSAPARAQAACDDELIHRANDARRAGNDAEALPLFQDAWSTCRTLRSLAQAGLTEAAMGRWRAAARDLSAALTSRDDPWIARNLPRLAEALAQVETHLDREAGGAPAGRVLSPAEERPNFVASTPAPVAPSVLVPRTRPPLNPAADHAAPGSARRALAWTSLALGAVAVGGATATLVLRAEEAAAFNANPACRVGDGRPFGGAECAARFERGADLQALSIAGYAVGGALAVTAIVLFATGSNRAASSRAHIACSPSLAAPGVTCGATF